MSDSQTGDVSVGVTSIGKDLFARRLITGLIQGLLLYVLLNAARHHYWFSPHSLFYAPLVLAALLIPPVRIIGLNHLRPRRQLLWCVVLAAVVAIIGYHDAWRVVQSTLIDGAPGRVATIRFPSFRAVFFSSVVVYLSYTLIVAGETAKAWFAPYESYFVLAWKLLLQIFLSLLFVGVFRLVLWAGAALFMLLKLSFFEDLLKQPWFYMPVSAMAFAVGLHITDVRADFIRGMRTLLLTLMSWLLPVLVVIVAGFLISSVFTGFKPLWATKSTAGVLLGVAALEIALINAVFKSGVASEPLPRVLRVSARVGSLTLLALVLAAGYALAVRIAQYGLTNSRVLACAWTLVAGCYALGYAWAAVDRRSWLHAIAPTNVLTAWVSLVVLFALLTPIADPDRLSVDSQVTGLLTGRTTPDKFDFNFLRFRSSAYGEQALARLQSMNTGPNAATIRELSTKAQQLPRFAAANRQAPDVAALSHNIVSRTPKQDVPTSFLATDWQRTTEGRWLLPACLMSAAAQCDAYLADLTGQGKPNVLLIPSGPGSLAGTVFGQNPAGEWQLVGSFHIAPDCVGVRDALAHGNFRLAEPALHDIEVNGQRVQMEPLQQGVVVGCRQ